MVLPDTENEEVVDGAGEDETKTFLFELTPPCAQRRTTAGTRGAP
jgi:hypothetical protein